jgi:hypothetical protein
VETMTADPESETIPLDEETAAALNAAAATPSTGKAKSKAKKRKESNGVSKKASRKQVRAKAAKVKSTTSKAAKAKSNQGQNGAPLDLAVDDMNPGEKKVLAFLYSNKGERKAYTLSEITKSCFRKSPGTSWARNALRRLVRGAWAEKYERGTYRITDKARKRNFTMKG